MVVGAEYHAHFAATYNTYHAVCAKVFIQPGLMHILSNGKTGSLEPVKA
jgi:hypothetical protein